MNKKRVFLLAMACLLLTVFITTPASAFWAKEWTLENGGATYSTFGFSSKNSIKTTDGGWLIIGGFQGNLLGGG
jgi:hypothetical protein